MSLAEDLRDILNKDAETGQRPDQTVEWLYALIVPRAEPPPIGSSHSRHGGYLLRWISALTNHVERASCEAHGQSCIMIPLPDARGVCFNFDRASKMVTFTVVRYNSKNSSHTSEH